MSMVRYLASRDGARFKLLLPHAFARRTPRFSTSCRRVELSGSVSIHHDGGDPARSFDLWPLFERPRPVHVVLLRAAAAAAGDSRHVRPLAASAIHIESFADAGTLAVPDDRPFRVRLAQVRGHGAKSARTSRSSRRCASTASTCRAPAKAAPAARAGRGCSEVLPIIATSCSSEGEQADNIMVCVSRARSPEIVIDR